MHEDARIDRFDLGGRRRLALCLKVLEIGVDLRQRRAIESAVEALGLENRHDGLRRRLARERAQRRNRTVEAPRAGFRRRHVHRRGHAARHVRVDLKRHLGQRLPERRHELARRARREDARHVLDRQRVDAHRRLLLRKLHVVGDRMDRRRRVADRALRVPAVLLHAFDRLLEVARIVQRVKDAEDVHPVLARERGEALDDVVRIVLVAEDVLPAE